MSTEALNPSVEQFLRTICADEPSDQTVTRLEFAQRAWNRKSDGPLPREVVMAIYAISECKVSRKADK